MRLRCAAICLFSMLILILPVTLSAQDDTVSFTLIHTNDEHAHHLPNDEGDGGAARAAAVINQIRAEVEHSVLMNAGDRFTGTLFHQQYRGQDSVRLMNAMNYSVMALGNHEFDDGNALLADFLTAVEFPVLSANTSVRAGDPIDGLFQPYTILTVAGESIGVIGLTTVETWNIARPSAGTNFDGGYAAIINDISAELQDQGINKIVLISHIGLAEDISLAAELEAVDIIVGSHSHSLLSNTYANAEGPYPLVMQNLEGDPLLIVQSGGNTLYVGRLDVTFDSAGVLTDWGGDSIFLSRFITPDPEIDAIVADLAAPLIALQATVIGQSTVVMVGDRAICRVTECNLGSLVADAMRAQTRAQIAFINSGSIRTNIPNAPLPAELTLPTPLDITLGDVLDVLPFGNLISTFELTGADLLLALENGVSRVGEESGTGRFPQVSGMRFTFDSSQPSGSRIVSVEVEQPDGSFSPLDPEMTYSIVSNDFLRSGGDGYGILAQLAINPYDFGRPVDEVVAEYINALSPITPTTDGRIVDIAAQGS